MMILSTVTIHMKFSGLLRLKDYGKRNDLPRRLEKLVSRFGYLLNSYFGTLSNEDTIQRLKLFTLWHK